jgi:hypothetical protein
MAARIVKQATDPDDAQPTPAQLNGRAGGLKGGKARADRMTPEQRSEAARRAVQARWDAARREKGQ